MQNKKISLQKWRSTKILMESEVNNRAMMAALYYDTGNADIAKMGAFLGKAGNKSWELSASTHTEQVNEQITSVVYTVME